MAIAFDASADGGVAFAASLTWSHTCTGADGVLYVGFTIVANGGVDPGGGTRTVTYNGVAMTEIGIDNDGAGAGSPGAIVLYRLANPATGAHTVSVSTSVSAFAVLGQSASYTGAAGTEDVTPVSGHNASTADFSLGITPVSAGCWTIFVTKNDVGLGSAGTNSHQVLSSANGDSIWDSNAIVTAGAAYTMHATSVATKWRGVINAFGPASSTITFAPASVVSTWVLPAQTLGGTGTATLAPASVVSTWTLPAQSVTLAGTISLPTATATWVLPAQTLTPSGTASLAPDAVVFTWRIPSQTITGGIQGHGNILVLFDLLGDVMPAIDKYIAITPDDTKGFPIFRGMSGPGPYPCSVLYVGGAGDVVAINEDGTLATFVGVTAGSFIPGKFVRVNSTNTTATSILAGYSI